MNRRLVVGPSAKARLQKARAWFEELPPQSHLLLLSQEQESADHFTRRIAASRGSLFGIHRAHLDRLAYRVALPTLAAAGIPSLSRLGQEAVMAHVVDAARREKELGPFTAVAGGPGLVRALTSTLHECRLHHVTAKILSAAGPSGETLALLLERYEASCREHGVADHAHVLRVAAETLEPIDVPVLLLDVTIETPAEATFLRAVANAAPAVLATLPSGDRTSLVHLRNALGCEPSDVAATDDTTAAIRDLQDFVFSDEIPASHDRSGDVAILSAPGEAQEAVELVRAVLTEADRGVRFDDMAVLLRSPDIYTPLLEDAFRRANVPAYFENGTKRPDPAGRAFLALLDCAAEEMSASSFAEYLSLSQIPRLDANGAPRPGTDEDEDEDEPHLWVPPQHTLAPRARDVEPRQLELFAEPELVKEPEKEASIEGGLRTPWRWEKLLVDAAVIGGRDRWERRLIGLDRELELRASELDDDSPEAESQERERAELGHLRRFALPLIEALGQLPSSATWRDWLHALEGLAIRGLSRPEGVLGLLKELAPMGSVGPVELFEVRAVLSERLTLLSQQPADTRYGKVWVAPIGAVRGASFEVVLVPGVAERMFPKKIAEDPLLLDREREILAIGLPLQRDRIARERLALRLAVGAASKKIVFSYPSVDLAKGRAKVPSFYLLEVARASAGELPDFETLERDAASSSGARLGWPAPRDRARAIDSTEFDLAFLSDALKRETSESEVRGTGRYLVDVNPALARSLRAKYQRGRSGKFTAADGFLEPSQDSRLTLAKHRLRERPYSVTALEKYAACPYRFYLNAVLRLRPRETAESITHLDALTRGHILHDAQFHVLERLGEAELLPVRPENIDDVLALFEVVFDDVADRFHEELAPAIERIWRDELERIRFDLRGWLRRGAAREDGFVPCRREFTFGMKPRGPADPASTLEVAALESGLSLRGAIDLVERRADGKVRITDHKSGRVWMPEGAILNGGESLQPVLYALAYEALTGEEVESSRLYYCTQRGGYAERTVYPDLEALEVVSEFQRRLDEIIELGFFPASPKPPLGCKYCDYLPVCGPRMDVDARRKQNDPRLSPLNWLRNLT